MPPSFFETLQLPLCIVLGLLPGLYTYWSSRRSATTIDQPGARERYMAIHLTAARLVGGLAVVGIVAGWGKWEGVTVALMPVGLVAGSYPSRKLVWGETWSFLDYAADRLGQVLAVFGFWLLLALGPLVTLRLAGMSDVKALALLVVLAAWMLFHDRIIPRLMRALPFHEPDLLARFRAIAARSSAPMPEVLRAGVAGGTVANGFAFPGRSRSRVILGRTMLETLEPEESAAIFAHEQAHLEQHRRGEWRWRTAFSWMAVVGAAAVVHIADGWRMATLAGLGWLVMVCWAFTRALRRLQQETIERDRRAVELCGDAETYARALTRVHQLMGIPRRWSADLERETSHPSLARRLAALRGPRAEQPALPVVAVADTTQPGLVMVLDGEGCRWYAGVESPIAPDAAPTTGHMTAQRRYDDLAELVGGASLVATDGQGQSWRLVMTSEDARRVQAHLDAVDHRLGAKVPAGALTRGRGKVWLFWVVAVIAYLVAWHLASSRSTPSPRPATQAVAETFRPLSPEESARLDDQRALIAAAVEQRYERKLTRTRADLALLQRLVNDGFYARDQTYQLQALGVVFGDVLASELPLRWVTVTDEYGTDPTLRLRQASWRYNALTMISKRVERGEDVDVAALFEGVRASVQAQDLKPLAP